VTCSSPSWKQFTSALPDGRHTSQMEDRALFPKDAGSTFPSNFMDIIKRIFKRLFRVYAHIYHTHFVEMCNMQAEAHLNTCFKHFIFFAKVCACALHARQVCIREGTVHVLCARA
jgi:Mob1/phocein family